jgi:AraC-like DNA-binding protein
MWIERQMFEELSALVRDLACCQQRLVAWLDRCTLEPACGVGPEAGDKEVRRRAGRVHSRDVARALGYIERHYNEVVGLTTLANHLGCSRTYLARTFRREMGRTIGGHVRGVRLKRAVVSVRGGDKIEAAMLAVGYRSKRNFYRLFRSRLGTTPGAVRGLGALKGET